MAPCYFPIGFSATVQTGRMIQVARIWWNCVLSVLKWRENNHHSNLWNINLWWYACYDSSTIIVHTCDGTS